jgi:hypothetical protein
LFCISFITAFPCSGIVVFVFSPSGPPIMGEVALRAFHRLRLTLPATSGVV